MASAMYLRKSRADREAEARGDGETLARHEAILTSLAAKMDITIGAVYKEIVSGETIAARPRMQQLLLEVMQGRWDSVLVMEVERLARGDTKDQGTVAEAFKFSGTRIVTPTKTYDPNNEFDEEYFEFSLFMSRREYKTINRRIQTGRKAAFQDGWYIAGAAPYGYEKVKHKGDKGFTLQIIETEASVVRMIFQLYANGEQMPDGSLQTMGSYQIRDRLNQMHIPSRTGGRWSSASIMEILRNPTYTGYQRWGWRKPTKTLVDGVIVESRPKNEDCLKVRGRFPAIIENELYERAQAVRKGKRSFSGGASNALQNPLTGLVYCSQCNTLMTRQLSNTRDRYAILRCPNSQCRTVSSPLYLIEKKLVEGLLNWILRYELEWSQEPDQDQANLLQVTQNSIQNLTTEYERTKQQLSSTYDFLEQGVYTLAIFRERRKVLEEKKTALEDQLSQLNQEIDRIEACQHARRNFLPAAKRILETYWDTDDAETRNSMLKELLDHVDYSKTERTKKGQRDSADFILHFYPRLPESR